MKRCNHHMLHSTRDEKTCNETRSRSATQRASGSWPHMGVVAPASSENSIVAYEVQLCVASFLCACTVLGFVYASFSSVLEPASSASAL